MLRLLSDENFNGDIIRGLLLRHPDLAVRLMERARAARAPALDERLDALSVLRFRVWHPGSRRVGLKARALRRR